MKQIVAVCVYSDDDKCNLPTNVRGFMAFWNEKLDLVPEEYKESATIDIDAKPFCDFANLSVEICYYRSETDEEEQQREQREREQAERRRQKELKELDRLRQKYEEDGR